VKGGPARNASGMTYHHILLTGIEGKTLREKMMTKRSISSKAEVWFVRSARGIYLITGTAKIFSAFGRAKLLMLSDPVVGLPWKYLLLITGICELTVACIWVSEKYTKIPLLAITWLTTAISVYRFGMWWANADRPCGCLGGLTDALNISPRAADAVMRVLLIYLLVSAYSFIFLRWLRYSGEQRNLSPALGFKDPA